MKHNYSYSFLAFLIGSAVAMECIAADLPSPEKQHAEGMGYVKAEVIGQPDEKKQETELQKLSNSTPTPAADPPPGMMELYTFSGVSDDGAQGYGDEATVIHCTNIGSSAANVEVQVFSSGGGTTYPGTATLNAGETYTFSTQNTNIYFDDIFLGGPSGTNAILQGHGRVFSESANIICTAQMLDGGNYPPKIILNLEMLRSETAPQPTVPPVSAGDNKLRYYFTGVSDDGSKGYGDEATVIHCTNIGDTAANVEVQVYSPSSGSSYTGTASLNDGDTYTFSTQNTNIYFDDIFLGGGLGTNAIFQGHGRVLSDNDTITCTAQMLDAGGYPPEYGVVLPMFDQDGYPANIRKRTVYYPIISN